MHWLLPKMLCVLALLACASLAQAQIYHCIGAHGESVYSGEPCGAPASASSITTQPGSFGGVCARSPRALQKTIGTAFASHDVNLFAGLILWQGVDQASVRAMLQSLSAWLQQPLKGIAIAYPATAPPMLDAVAAPPRGVAMPATPTGFEISTGGVVSNTRDFGVTQFGGCWWLTFPEIDPPA